jgi:DNA mismatch repair ATPase MutS
MNEGMENLKQIEDLEELVHKRTYRTGEVTQLRRIADAIEEILRLVKKDMDPRTLKEPKK